MVKRQASALKYHDLPPAVFVKSIGYTVHVRLVLFLGGSCVEHAKPTRISRPLANAKYARFLDTEG